MTLNCIRCGCAGLACECGKQRTAPGDTGRSIADHELQLQLKRVTAERDQIKEAALEVAEKFQTFKVKYQFMLAVVKAAQKMLSFKPDTNEELEALGELEEAVNMLNAFEAVNPIR